MMNKINWFPGHMHKATNEILQKLKIIDVVIEVVDARCVYSSSNPDLKKLFQNKPYLTVALKSDLAIIHHDPQILYISIKQPKDKKILIDQLYEVVKPKMEKLHAKGLVNPKFTVLVVGLPNIGKSSLINFLKNKSQLKTANLPGVTKRQSLVNINKNFDLIDTPGIFVKNIDDQLVAYKLGLINCIKKEVLPLEQVLKSCYEYYQLFHPTILHQYYDIPVSNTYEEFINSIAERFGYWTNHHEIDISRLEDKIFMDFSLAKICKVNYDR